MRVVCDIETDLTKDLKPTVVHLIVLKDIDTGEYHVFREPSTNGEERERFLELAKGVSLWVGHNYLGFDYPVLCDRLSLEVVDVAAHCIDTLILSRLVDYPRGGHSIEDYGVEFGIEKGNFNDFSKYSSAMEEYCIRDVDICHRIYLKYLRYIQLKRHAKAILIEHRCQLAFNDLRSNGFHFNTDKALKLLSKVQDNLVTLDKDITDAFPPRLVLLREITPRTTKFGTLNKSDFRFERTGDLSSYNGGSFCLLRTSEFNPSSHKQIIEVLSAARWQPIEKTKTHIETERELNQLKRLRKRDEELDIRLKELYDKLQSLQKFGWKINEANLSTLPPSAPPPARTLARRILLEARRRTLTEWVNLVSDDGRIHGDYMGIGAWTHRMAHQKPNTANITNEKDTSGNVRLLGGEMRALWSVPKNRLLVGVDAEGIQLRIFAHYINDPEFTKALVEGKKEDKSDPHSLNQRILGNVCKSRAAAKRFIYALLLGAGLGKLAEVLGCSRDQASEALDRLLTRYTGFEYLKREVIPQDARRGWFTGLDGRDVRIPGDTTGVREHLAMSGYLQNGEAVVMKHAMIKWIDHLHKAELQNDHMAKLLSDWKLVNFVHDEWQTECANDMEVALFIAKTQADSLREVGEELGLLCPLAGSYYNDDLKDYTIGTNWKVTH